jgi:hypothetical protein
MIDQILFPPEFFHFNEQHSYYNQILKPYYDNNKPSFFYSTLQVNDILNYHNSIAIIIVNNNTKPIEDNLQRLKESEKIFFIATSKLMSLYLDNLGLKYIEFPWHHANIEDIKLYPKGNSIYFYGVGGSNFYGYPIIRKILSENFPYLNLICTQFFPNPIYPFHNYDKSELNEVYKKIFLSVRLTRFDGLSDTVQSLGLRGIKTIWNGGTPSSLSYSSEQDIIDHIRNEETTVGHIDADLANRCLDYLNPLNEKYKYIFNVDTYINNVITPKMFFNDEKLSFSSIDEIIHNSFIDYSLKI